MATINAVTATTLLLIQMVFFVFTGWTQTTAITGDSADGSIKDSISRYHLSYGVNLLVGLVDADGGEIKKASTHPRFGSSAGLYFQGPLSKRLYFYLNVNLAQRGFRIKYSDDFETATIWRNIEVNGFQKLYYIDKIKCLGFQFTEDKSMYLGLMTSFRINAKMKYHSKSTSVNKTTGRQVALESSYESSNNDAIDLIDFAIVIGYKMLYKDKIGFSVRFTRDFAAVNVSSVETFRNTYFNSSLQMCVDIPLGYEKVYLKGK